MGGVQVRRLLLVLVVLALAMLACQPNGPVATPQVIVVTATPEPMKVLPTVVPIKPMEQYDATGLPSQTIAYLEQEGFDFSSQQVTGVLSCSASTCTHWEKGTIAVSFYVNRGELTGVLVSFAADDLGSYTGEVSGYVFGSSGVPEDAVDAIGKLIEATGGSRDNPSGWRSVVGEKDGRIYIMVAIPGRNVGSAGGQSASA